MKLRITLNPDEETDLSTIGTNKIYITKISSSSDNILTLFCPIKVCKDYGSGSRREYFINASPYFSNRNPGICTDRPMNIPVINCQITKLSITNNSNIEDFNLYCEYEIISEKVDYLEILIASFSEGNIYSLHPSSKIKLKDTYPNSIIAGSLKIDHQTGTLFNLQYGSLTREIIKALTGLTEFELYSIGKFNIIDARSGELKKSWIYEEE
ncbi:MAG: hypothetical protein AB7O73_05700 [Bacteroidia bacterium]